VVVVGRYEQNNKNNNNDENTKQKNSIFVHITQFVIHNPSTHRSNGREKFVGNVFCLFLIINLSTKELSQISQFSYFIFGV
jgi:hypothetical protein